MSEGTAASAFGCDGFIGPFNLLTRAQCALILQHHRLGKYPAPKEGEKGRACGDRFFYDVAADQRILALVRPLIGDDIVLWGASIVERVPGRIHPWHTDIESSAIEGGFASIWIGLKNTSRESALLMIGRSHSFGKTIQQVQHENGRRRGEASDEMVLEWARRLDPEAALVQPDMSDGDAIVFDGRLWHSSKNRRQEGRRAALLLQYGAADRQVRQPDFTQMEWPLRFTEHRLPVILVSGKARADINNVVPAPQLFGPHRPAITTAISPLSLPLDVPPDTPWKPFSCLYGPTSTLEAMESHASVLAPGHSPHPPHVHDEEELLIALDGEAEIVISDGPAIDGARIERLRPGDFVYYPAYQHHTIRNAQGAPITYLMFKWQSPPTVQEKPAETAIFRLDGIKGRTEEKAFNSRLLFEKPTAYLQKLHAHVTDLQPGGGYEPHADAYDVAIVVLTGKIETLGRVVEPFGVIYYSAGEMHGMRNAGEQPARYLVFEFHAPKQARAS